MPYLSIALAGDLFETARDTLLRECSQTIAKVLGKDERYVCVSCVHRPMLFGGDPGPAAFLDVRSVGGLDEGTVGALTKQLSAHVSSEADVPMERIFVHFTDVSPERWGWRGETLDRMSATP